MGAVYRTRLPGPTGTNIVGHVRMRIYLPNLSKQVKTMFAATATTRLFIGMQNLFDRISRDRRLMYGTVLSQHRLTTIIWQLVYSESITHHTLSIGETYSIAAR